MTKEYYEAKAKLCRDLFIQQITDGNIKEASANLLRMVKALNEYNLLEYKEEKANERLHSNASL